MSSSMKFCLLVVCTIVLISGCSRGRLVLSTYAPSTIKIDGSISDWPRERIQLSGQSEYDLFFSNDDDFLYVFISLRNNQLFQNIQRYGLTLYFDKDKNPRRAFGIVYPTGVLHVLSDIPGARKEYLENPGWSNIPENKRLIESIEESIPDRVMLIQRNNKRDPMRPVPVNMESLRAQSLEMFMERTQSNMNIEMKIPLRLSRTTQFAVNASPGDEIYFGFEVTPPPLEEILGEDYRSEQMNPVQRDPYGNRVNQQRAVNQRLVNQLRGEFSSWTRVRLTTSR